MIDLTDPHAELHSEHGALPGEHPGRAAKPIVKVHDLAWLEFEKPNLEQTERFALAFGFTTAFRTARRAPPAGQQRRRTVRDRPPGAAVPVRRPDLPGGRL